MKPKDNGQMFLFLIGSWHEDGIAVNFEYNIKTRNLKCYKIGHVEAQGKDIPKQPINHEMGYGDTALVCPNCKQSAIWNPFRTGRELYPHCPWCGQKLEVLEYECRWKDGGKNIGKSCPRFQIGENREKNGQELRGRRVVKRYDDIRKALEDPTAKEITIQKHTSLGKSEKLLDMIGAVCEVGNER